MGDSKTALKMLTVRVPAELHHEAKLLSVREGKSLNSLMVGWLERWVERKKEVE